MFETVISSCLGLGYLAIYCYLGNYDFRKLSLKSLKRIEMAFKWGYFPVVCLVALIAIKLWESGHYGLAINVSFINMMLFMISYTIIPDLVFAQKEDE